MRILFLNIAWMENYRGITDDDKPIGGGSWVTENNDAHEKYNFQPEELQLEEDGEPARYCLGFFETKESRGKLNQLHIEKIRGCELLGKDTEADDVLVVWCAKHPAHLFTTVVGWYKHATVYRDYKATNFNGTDGGIYTQYYNVVAKAKDCVLLPTSQRSRKTLWEVPRKKANGRPYGFGRANVWFANEKGNDKLETYVRELVDKIDNYYGENWINKRAG